MIIDDLTEGEGVQVLFETASAREPSAHPRQFKKKISTSWTALKTEKKKGEGLETGVSERENPFGRSKSEGIKGLTKKKRDSKGKNNLQVRSWMEFGVRARGRAPNRKADIKAGGRLRLFPWQG